MYILCQNNVSLAFIALCHSLEKNNTLSSGDKQHPVQMKLKNRLCFKKSASEYGLLLIPTSAVGFDTQQTK